MSKNRKYIIGIVSVMIILMAAALFGIYNYAGTHFLRGSLINGYDVSGLTQEKAEKYLSEETRKDYSLSVYGNNNVNETFSSADFGLTFIFDLTDLMAKNQNRVFSTGKRVYETVPSVTYEEPLLNSTIKNSAFFDDKNINKAKDAYIYLNDDMFEIIPETEGSVPVLEKMKRQVANAVTNMADSLLLTQDCYQGANITQNNRRLNSVLSELNNAMEARVIYDFGEKSVVVDKELIKDWLMWDDEEIRLDEDAVKEWIRTLASDTDTAYTTRAFDVGEKQITVSGPYGYKIDQQAEYERLSEEILSGSAKKREPVYSIKAASRENELGDRFVEVDITNQTVRLYDDGNIIVETACVTGNTSNGNGTPEGIYPITYTQKNAVLKGPGYSSPVSYWMPFNGGIGLHDATWRSSFGGSIYKTNGSHGCVNLPLSAAKTIFEYAYAGMPVICHF